MVKNLRHLPYPERLRRLGVPSLCYRRRRGDMITVFQLLHGGIAPTPETFPTTDTHLTRQEDIHGSYRSRGPRL